MACGTYTNTGAKECKSLLAQTKMLFFMPIYGSDGTKNKITLENAKLLAQWILKFNALDDRDRVYPTPLLENVTNERAATEFETLNSGRKVKMRKGQRTFIGYIVQGGFEALKQFEAWEDSDNFGFLGIDLDANFWYKKIDGSTDLYPIAVESGSFDTGIIFPTDTTSEKEMIQFDVASYEKDSCFKVLAFSDLTDFNPLTDSYGLIDADVVCASGTTTTVVFDVTDLNGFPVENLATANLVDVKGGTTGKVYNVTDASSVTATLAESTTVAGKYTATFLAQTASDVIRITIEANGYDVSTDTQIV